MVFITVKEKTWYGWGISGNWIARRLLFRERVMFFQCYSHPITEGEYVFIALVCGKEIAVQKGHP